MNEQTKKNLFIIGMAIGIIAFVYKGIEPGKKQDALKPGDLSMEEQLLLEREQAKKIKEDELTKVVSEKTSMPQAAQKVVENDKQVGDKSNTSNKTKMENLDPLCKQIIEAGGECEPSSGNSDNYTNNQLKANPKSQENNNNEQEEVHQENNSNVKKVSYPQEYSRKTTSSDSPNVVIADTGESKFARRSKFYGKVSEVTGASRVSDVRMIKAGCTVLAQLETGVTVTTAVRKGVTFRTRGPLYGCELPRDFALRFIGKAKLNDIQKSINVEIDTCTSNHTDVRSTSCVATVESISPRGGDLEGDIYDQSGWSIFWNTLLLMGASPTLAKLTETAATSTSLWSGEMSKQALDIFGTALGQASAKINGIFSGREISVNRDVYVKIKITEDFVY